CMAKFPGMDGNPTVIAVCRAQAKASGGSSGNTGTYGRDSSRTRDYGSSRSDQYRSSRDDDQPSREARRPKIDNSKSCIESRRTRDASWKDGRQLVRIENLCTEEVKVQVCFPRVGRSPDCSGETVQSGRSKDVGHLGGPQGYDYENVTVASCFLSSWTQGDCKLTGG
ncbi:MAG: hypothetical protein RLN77_09400, partial [Rhodospirillales bacterium]